MSNKDDSNLLKRIDSLIKTNKNLRKKLGSQDSDCSEKSHKKKKEISKNKEHIEEKVLCDLCKGTVLVVSLKNLSFEVCQKCKSRKKLK